MSYLLLVPLLFGLSFLSGMLGLGVAFVAIPVLGLFGYDLHAGRRQLDVALGVTTGGPMPESRTTWTQIAAATLGIIGLGAIGYGLFLVVLGATAGDLLGSSLDEAAAFVVIIIGALAVVVGLVSAIGAIGVWQARAATRVVGLVVGAVVILGPLVARISGGWHDALWVSIGLGAVLVGSLLLDRRVATDRT